jgi:hypothetical protein
MNPGPKNRKPREPKNSRNQELEMGYFKSLWDKFLVDKLYNVFGMRLEEKTEQDDWKPCLTLLRSLECREYGILIQSNLFFYIFKKIFRDNYIEKVFMGKLLLMLGFVITISAVMAVMQAVLKKYIEINDHLIVGIVFFVIIMSTILFWKYLRG